MARSLRHRDFLEAISAWGLERALERSVGMFAFALWDREQRTLRLVRDRFGEKPLYYGWIGHDFLFASELKAIRRHPRFNGEIDRRALRVFASADYVPAPLSIYRGIFKLEPGCILTIGARRRAASRGAGNRRQRRWRDRLALLVLQRRDWGRAA